MNIEDQIRFNAGNNDGGHQFTKEGIMLGMFKLTIENNTMLNTLIKMVSKIYADMPMNPNIEGQEAEFADMANQYEQANKSLSRLFEQVSVQSAFDFAVEHDHGLDDEGGLTVTV